jgi:hypothetical protein
MALPTANPGSALARQNKPVAAKSSQSTLGNTLLYFPASRAAFLLDRIFMLSRCFLALLTNTRPRTFLSLGRCFALCLLAGSAIASAQAQAPTQTQTQAQTQPPAPSGALTGIVTDPSGALVPSATLTLSPLSGPPLTADTDPQGAFRFTAIPPGAYALTIEARGFRQEQRDDLQIQPGQTLRLNIQLRIDVQRQQIDVTGDQLDSSPDHSLGAIVLNPTDLKALPTNRTDLLTQLQLIAGSDPTTAAQLYLDGFTATALPPKSAIREVRINQNPYSAQYDSAGMGRIEVFTKPGSDKLHGDLTLLGDDSVLNSSNPYTVGQPPYSAFYAQGDINGPLTRNSSWFFTGDRQDVGSQSFVYATTSSTGPIYTTTVSSPQTSTDLGPRLDLQLGSIHTLTLRYQFGHQEQDNLLQSQLSLPSQAVTTRHTDQTLQISDTQAWTPNAVNETRFQFMRTNDSTVSLSSTPAILVQGAFNGGGNAVGQLHDGQNHYELQDYFSRVWGSHLLRVGARFRDIQDGNTSTAGYNGQYIFSSIQSYEITQQGIAQHLTPAQIRADGGGSSQLSFAIGTPRLAINVADLGLYVEDEWKVTANTTLDAGLRYETQSHIHDHADFAPRASWSWAIGATRDKPAKAVLRAGIGVFYQRFDAKYILNAIRENGINQQQFVVNNPDSYPVIPSPDQLGPTAQPSIYQIGPRLHAPYVVQQGVSLDKDFFKRLSLSIDYSFYRGVDQLLTRNINAPLPGTYNPNDPTSGIRPLGTLENIYQYESEGVSRRNRILLNVHYRTRPLTVFGIYMFGYSKADTAGASSYPSNQYDLHVDYGRAANDLRNRAYFGGLANLPCKFQLEPFLVLESSMPFNITTGTDLNGDSQFNDRPAFATDLTRPSVYRTKFGNFDADPIPGQKIVPINYGTGPSVAMLQLLFARTFALGPEIADPAASPATPAKGSSRAKADIPRKYQMNLGIEAQNILNIVNGGPPIGVLGAPLFGQSTSLSTTQYSNNQANRILYLHLDLSF